MTDAGIAVSRVWGEARNSGEEGGRTLVKKTAFSSLSNSVFIKSAPVVLHMTCSGEIVLQTQTGNSYSVKG